MLHTHPPYHNWHPFCAKDFDYTLFSVPLQKAHQATQKRNKHKFELWYYCKSQRILTILIPKSQSQGMALIRHSSGLDTAKSQTCLQEMFVTKTECWGLIHLLIPQSWMEHLAYLQVDLLKGQCLPFLDQYWPCSSHEQDHNNENNNRTEADRLLFSHFYRQP